MPQSPPLLSLFPLFPCYDKDTYRPYLICHSAFLSISVAIDIFREQGREDKGEQELDGIYIFKGVFLS